MEDYQKEFMSIKTSINQKDKLLLKKQDFFSVNITEEMRTKIKTFWNETNVEAQVAIFLENNGRASNMVTKAMQKFGDMYTAAKKNPSVLSAIDKAITDKTYFSMEVLPGFEGRLAMTQLFCNGRNSGGAFRMHNFFYMLPTKEFESESTETDDLRRIGEMMKNVDNYADFSKDAMYCLNLLKEVYGTIQLRYFKMGVFLGDYLPDNLWSAWRYMNCREFTFGQTTIIRTTAYDDFIDSAEETSKRFLRKVQPCILTQLWTCNIAIAVFSTLFENTSLLSFFGRNPKLAKKYGLTSACLASKIVPCGLSTGTRSSHHSETDSGSDIARHNQEKKDAPVINKQKKPSTGITKSQCAVSNGSDSKFSLSSGSHSLSHNSVSQTRSSRGLREFNLKKQIKPKQAKMPLMWTGPSMPSEDQRDILPRDVSYIDKLQEGRYLAFTQHSSRTPRLPEKCVLTCPGIIPSDRFESGFSKTSESYRELILSIIEPRIANIPIDKQTKQEKRYYSRNKKVHSRDRD